MKEERNFTEEQIDNMTDEEWYWNVYLKEKEPFIGKVVYMTKEEIISTYGSFLMKDEINKLKNNMKEEILTAKEWLEKEEKIVDELYYDAETYGEFEEGLESLLERYANYKNKVLEDRILEFREVYRIHPNISKYRAEAFDKHFGIIKK